MGELTDRRLQTDHRIAQIRGGLTEAEKLADGKACVYAIGSYGRGEACQHSDLDLFIVGRSRSDDKGRTRRRSMLSRLDEICIKAELIHTTRNLDPRGSVKIPRVWSLETPPPDDRRQRR